MKRFPGFIGASYLAASVNAACQRSENLFPEAIEADGETKSVGMLRMRPALGPPRWTLPTLPIRGLWAGGAPLTTGGRLFAVGGSKLYEVFATGAVTLIGDVSDDAQHSPVTMIPNGTQLGIVSAGSFYVATSESTIVQPTFIQGQGMVTVAGTAVTWLEGAPFQEAWTGEHIYINNTPFLIASVDVSITTLHPAQTLVLTASAGSSPDTGWPFFTKVVWGTADVNLTQVTWRSGPLFFPQMAGMAITISGLPFTVQSVQDQTHLTLVGSLVYLINQPWAIEGVPVRAQSGAFLDSYFIVSKPDSKEIDFSANFDGTTWDALDEASKEGYPDNVGTILADHEDLWIFGESSTEIWRAISTPPAEGAPMQRDPGAFIPIGLASIYAANRTRQGPIWLGTDLNGGLVAYRGQGYQPQRVSTHAIEQAWRKYATVADAESFVMEIDGHEWWVVTFKSADATWVYDLTASAQFGKPLWHEWMYSTDGVTFHRYPIRGHAYVSFATSPGNPNAAGLHWVGDAANGNIYPLSFDYFTDNGAPITCVRTFPHLSEAGLRQFFSRLQLDVETGVAPITVKLDWSTDNGHTFINARTITLTSLDDTGAANYRPYQRAMFNRLGSGRDRVFRVTVTGACPIALLNAYLDALVGGS